jgi:hypothetical protein
LESEISIGLKGLTMNINDVKKRAHSIPLTSPTYSKGPYRFVDREFLIVTYRTDPEKLRELVPEPLEVDMENPLVKYEFIRMPDSAGFGDYTESGQVIPVTFRGRRGAYVHAMYLDDHAPTAGGGARCARRRGRSVGPGVIRFRVLPGTVPCRKPEENRSLYFPSHEHWRVRSVGKAANGHTGS